jgi:hypothetical protein
VSRRSTHLLALGLTLAVAVPGVLAGAAAGSGTSSSPVADQGSSFKYRSLITAVQPHVAGLSVQVLQFADRLLLINHTGRTVTVYGYEGEPYERVLGNGTAERNTRSPATYLNKSFYGDAAVPPQADAKAPPSWQVIDRTGQLEWHDHRIHYTSPAIPLQVKDTGKRTLIFDWRVPISVGTSPGAVEGQLFWVPDSSKAPVAAIVIGALIVLGGLALVLVVRRRRRAPVAPGGGAGDAPGSSGPEPTAAPGPEAW